MVSRELRLRSEFEVRQVRSRGKAHADGPIVIRVLPNQLEPAHNRYAFVAGKRVGKAHERNRAKRLCREVIRAHHPQLKPGYDLVVIVRGNAAELPSLDAARAIIERLLVRARLLPAGQQVRTEHPSPT